MPAIDVYALNWLDWVCVAIIVFSGFRGARRGLILSLLDIGAALASIPLAGALAHPLTAVLKPYINLPEPLGEAAMFLGALVLAQVGIGMALGLIARGTKRIVKNAGPFGGVNALLGMIPGVAKGIFWVSLALLPFTIVPIIPPLSSAIAASQVAAPIVSGAQSSGTGYLASLGIPMPTIGALTPGDFPGVGSLLGATALLKNLPSGPTAGGTASGKPTSGGAFGGDSVTAISRALGAAAPSGGSPAMSALGLVGSVTPSPSDEDALLRLVNQARTDGGVLPLKSDVPLRDGARAHSVEMLQVGYLSPQTPEGRTPDQRLRSAGVQFTKQGEAVVLAPTAQIAFQTLANDPEQKATLLRGDVSLVGIGAIQSQFRGVMYTLDLTD